ncbi:hypothetical protein ACLB2K_052959 [Fragaria x ananassa]
MELSCHQEGQIPISIPIPIPIPINSSYGAGGHGHGHMIHHHHHHEPAAPHSHTLIHNNHLITSSAPPVVAPPPPQNQIPASINNNGSSIPTATSPDQEEQEEEDEEHANHVNVAYNHNNNNKKVVNNSIKYKECLKNHAAAMGGTATDGCGEFMPSGEEGTIEALNCSACNCHRNFHRKEIDGDHGMSSWDVNNNSTRMIMSYNNNMSMGGLMGTHLPSESDEQEQDQIHHHGHGGGVNVASRAPVQLVKKRFRTKFTQEQKEKMFNFAEKVGWKIQKQEEPVVQNFCHEIGVKRRVLKVWMHNNKHNLAKNKSQPPPSTTTA